MTDDYLAISNTGKNITISMTPGMKQRVCGGTGRVRFLYRNGCVTIAACLDDGGYKLAQRKNVWNTSFSSKRLPRWPIHARIVYHMPQIRVEYLAASVQLPNPVDPASYTLAPAKPAEPAMSSKYINLSGEYFEVLVSSEDLARFWKAYLRTLEKTEARHLFNAPDMVVAAITGGAIGVLITLLLAGAGVLK